MSDLAGAVLSLVALFFGGWWLRGRQERRRRAAEAARERARKDRIEQVMETESDEELVDRLVRRDPGR